MAWRAKQGDGNERRAQEGDNPSPRELMAKCIKSDPKPIVAQSGSSSHDHAIAPLALAGGNAESGKQTSFLIHTPRQPKYTPRGHRAGMPFTLSDVDGDLFNGIPSQPEYYPQRGLLSGSIPGKPVTNTNIM